MACYASGPRRGWGGRLSPRAHIYKCPRKNFFDFLPPLLDKEGAIATHPSPSRTGFPSPVIFYLPGGGAVFPSDIEETVLTEIAPVLRRCVHLLALLDSLDGHAVGQWGDVRVQGGSKTPAAERRAELLEELGAMSPKLLRLARKLWGNPPDSPRARYVAALLCGLQGEDLRKAAKLSRERLKDCRRWLRSLI